MALASVFDRGGGWVNVLHCLENHYMIDSTLAFVCVEVHLMAESATQMLELLMIGAVPDTGTFDGLVTRTSRVPEYRESDFLGILRRSCDTSPHEPPGQCVYTFQKTYFGEGIPANEAYEHPFHELEVVEAQCAISIYGLDSVEVPRAFSTRVAMLNGGYLIKIDAPEGQQWQPATCYGFRLGLFVSMLSTRWPSLLFPVPYPAFVFGYSRHCREALQREGIMEYVERCRLWYKFSSSNGLQSIKDTLKSAANPSQHVLASLQRQADIAHSDVWITMPWRMKLRQWVGEGDGFVHHGDARWLLHGPAERGLRFHSYQYKLGTTRQLSTTGMRRVSQIRPVDAAIQVREISLVNRVIVAVACLSVWSLAYAITGDHRIGAILWVFAILIIFGLEWLMARGEPAGWRRPFL
jgi:hypothetical protein